MLVRLSRVRLFTLLFVLLLIAGFVLARVQGQNSGLSANVLGFDGVDVAAVELPVTVVTPAQKAVIGGVVPVNVRLRDQDSQVEKVQFYADGKVFSTISNKDESGNWLSDWDTTKMAQGEHVLQVWAYYDGHIEKSETVMVTVDNIGPVVSWVHPSDGVNVAKEVALVVRASDDIPSALGVEFYLDEVGVDHFIGRDDDGFTPFRFNWDSTVASDGEHTLFVKVLDGRGNATVVEQKVVVVNKLADDESPKIVAVSPAEGALVVSGDIAVIQVEAMDNVVVDRVEFYPHLDATEPFCTRTGAPYVCPWHVPYAEVGSSLEFGVKVYDAQGNVTEKIQKVLVIK